MGARIKAIDALRGLAIIGMVLAGSIGWNSGLPAWMFHCQTPPPDYAFHPEVRGITWVDLVFPFFLFAMGAALPLAMRSRISRGEKTGKLIAGQIKRWLTLVLFGFAIGNAYRVNGSEVGGEIVRGLFMPAMWAGFFASLVRYRSKWINYLGYALVAGLLAVQWLVFGQVPGFAYADVIIMILASASLAGALLWLLSAGNPRTRLLILFFVVALKAVSSYTGLLEPLAIHGAASYIFNWGHLQYLVIVLGATFAGDYLYDWAHSPKQEAKVNFWQQLIAVLTVILQLWALLGRHIAIDVVLTLSLACAYVGLGHRKQGPWTALGLSGYAILIAGIMFDIADGGIAKDFCNLSYLLVTCGLGFIVTSVFFAMENAGKALGALVLCGQNPMIAYTVSSFVLVPIF
ncbi:MAG: DUF5009 domain-containing protein, partial [Bacteroidales bacterium]|nr:DUF5009 domain-containing protein [Candidatus Cryptobacteroides aphodequi]